MSVAKNILLLIDLRTPSCHSELCCVPLHFVTPLLIALCHVAFFCVVVNCVASPFLFVTPLWIVLCHPRCILFCTIIGFVPPWIEFCPVASILLRHFEACCVTLHFLVSPRIVLCHVVLAAAAKTSHISFVTFRLLRHNNKKISLNNLSRILSPHTNPRKFRCTCDWQQTPMERAKWLKECMYPWHRNTTCTIGLCDCHNR